MGNSKGKQTNNNNNNNNNDLIPKKNKTKSMKYERCFNKNNERNKQKKIVNELKISNKYNYIWGYNELSCKITDEDQASFILYKHKNDGIIYIWGVFDGHGGASSAIYTASFFLRFIKDRHNDIKTGIFTKNDDNIYDYIKFFKDACKVFDEQIGKENLDGGNTVVIVLYSVKYSKIISVNVGDSRCLITSNNGENVKQLSIDHNPIFDFDNVIERCKLCKEYKNDDDFKNIFRINTYNPFIYSKTDHTYHYRRDDNKETEPLSDDDKRKTLIISSAIKILNTISVSRAFGDFSLTVRMLPNTRIKPLLSNEPTIKELNINELDINDKDYIFISCDGPFDVLSNKSVISNMNKFIWDDTSSDDDTKISENEPSKPGFNIPRMDESCMKLAKLSHDMGTIDDISIFIIPLKQLIINNNDNNNDVNIDNE